MNTAGSLPLLYTISTFALIYPLAPININASKLIGTSADQVKYKWASKAWPVNMNASELRGLAPDKQLTILAEFTAFSSVTNSGFRHSSLVHSILQHSIVSISNNDYRTGLKSLNVVFLS